MDNSIYIKDDRFFKVILSSIADGVFTVDEGRRITSFNPAAEKITGVPLSQAVGKKCYEVFHSDVCEEGCLLERTLKTGQECIDMQVNILDRSGKRVPISISTAVLRDDDGSVLGAVETFRDMSMLENLRKELTRSYNFEDIVTKSPTLLKLLSILPDAAESESNVLIQGPSGSGKELFARAVHNLSPRKNKPYIIINCGTLPVTLFESELFGYVKGAFTDAKKDKLGKISLAEGGTVFFDEIADLPLKTQVKLLRLIQQREYEAVGGLKTQKANIRIVAATNRDLREQVTEGNFRNDLYFRLAVIRFQLPPLRERREDIPYLIENFIQRFSARSGKKIIGVSPAVMDVLMRLDYPGNVRELENIIEYAFALNHSRIIDLKDLPNEVLQQSASLSDKVQYTRISTLQISAQDYIKKINNALRESYGNTSIASKKLKIHRTTLWRQMKKLGIDPAEFKQE